MSYPSVLAGYENAPALPTDFNSDGKSLKNLPGPQSKAYDAFPSPIDPTNNGFDFHIYYMQAVTEEAKFAKDLHERVRREFPEVRGFVRHDTEPALTQVHQLRIYKFWDRPVGK